MRAIDLPAGGLDSARLRFEMMTPGNALDRRLHVVGEAAPKAVRLNAQRTLLAPCRPIARSTTPSSPACPARTGLAIPASWPSAGRTGPRNFRDVGEPAVAGPAAASALSPDRRLR